MRSFTNWMDLVGDQVSKLREKETGRITLLYSVEVDEGVMLDWFSDGVRPSHAAKRYMAGEGHKKFHIKIPHQPKKKDLEYREIMQMLQTAMGDMRLGDRITIGRH